VSVALASKPKLRFSGRSLLAFVIEPVQPVAEWLAALDDTARQSIGFFTDRPVIVDLSTLAPDRHQAQAILDALRARAIRVIAVEGIDPNWLDPTLAPMARGMDSRKPVEISEKTPRNTGAPARPAASRTAAKVIDRPVRSGQSIFNADGDLTILGSVSSGAEIAAAGSIHIYGALRGRAFAGVMGGAEARIFCRKFEAELVAINGCYMTAEKSPADLIGKPVHIRLEGDAIEMNVSD
jgi:septum site-determining protein MinC